MTFKEIGYGAKVNGRATVTDVLFSYRNGHLERESPLNNGPWTRIVIEGIEDGEQMDIDQATDLEQSEAAKDITNLLKRWPDIRFIALKAVQIEELSNGLLKK